MASGTASDLVPGRGRVPYDRRIVGDNVYMNTVRTNGEGAGAKLVQVVRLQGGDNQVTVVDTDGFYHYPSVDRLTPAISSTATSRTNIALQKMN